MKTLNTFIENSENAKKTAKIYRIIELKDKLNTQNIGVNWSFDMAAAEAFGKSWIMNFGDCLLLTAVVNFSQIDWEQTFANMNITEYTEEYECFLYPNENLNIGVIWTGENTEKYEEGEFEGNTGNDEKEDETRASTEDIEYKDIVKLQNELLEWITTE